MISNGQRIGFLVLLLGAALLHSGTASFATSEEKSPGQKLMDESRTCRSWQNATLLFKTIPKYPASVRMDRIEGDVSIEAVLTRKGRLEDMKVVRSPDDRLVAAAIAAAKQWRYAPALCDETPVDIHFTLRVNFSLQGIGSPTLNPQYQPRCEESLEDNSLVGQVQLLPADYQWSDYYPQIYYGLQSSLYRALADEMRRGTFGVSDAALASTVLRACSVVHFTIDRKGKISNPFVMEATGNQALANIPLLALRNLRLQPLPQDFPQEHADVIEAFTIQIKDFRAFKTQMLMRRERRSF